MNRKQLLIAGTIALTTALGGLAQAGQDANPAMGSNAIQQEASAPAAAAKKAAPKHTAKKSAHKKVSKKHTSKHAAKKIG